MLTYKTRVAYFKNTEKIIILPLGTYVYSKIRMKSVLIPKIIFDKGISLTKTLISFANRIIFLNVPVKPFSSRKDKRNRHNLRKLAILMYSRKKQKL